MAVLVSNNATSTLASDITSGATSLSVQSGDAAKFPSPTGTDWFPLTVVKADGTLEIMKCTARSGAVLTVARGEEGTTAVAFSAGDRIDLRLTAGAIAQIQADASAAAVPAGTVADFAGSSAPAGWLKANGAAVSRTAYAALFAAIGTTYGAGNGSTTFNLPDFRGEFRRGLDDGRGIDTGRALGSSQADTLKSHTHYASTSSDGSHGHTGSTDSAGAHGHTGSAVSGGAHSHTGSTGSAGSHSHTGSTGSAGSHAHTVSAWGVGGTTDIVSDVHNTNDATAGTQTTSYAGDHSHWLSIDAAGAHTHSVTVDSGGAHSHSLSIDSGGAHSHSLSINAAGAHTHAVTVNSTGDAETRPRNVAVLACIKY